MSKISWSKALIEYLKDETSSYASIARKHGVSLQAVKKKAGRENWVSLRQKSIQKVNQELPELIGEGVADVNARQAQLGRLLQAIALREIKERDLKPENFMQALRTIVEGIKIEREAVELDKKVTNVAVGVRFSSPEYRKNYEYQDDLDEIKKQTTLVNPPVQKPAHTASTPVLTPQLLEEIQRRLKDIKEGMDKLKTIY